MTENKEKDTGGRGRRNTIIVVIGLLASAFIYGGISLLNSSAIPEPLPPTNTATMLPSPTKRPTATSTPRPTQTPEPTATATRQPPTRTPTKTSTPAHTKTPPPTKTLVPPTQPPATAVPPPTVAPTQPPATAIPPPTVAPTDLPPPSPTDTPQPTYDYIAPGVWRCPGDTAGAAYVGSIESDKFHYLSCRWAQKILPGNRICFENRDSAVNFGYLPCGTCGP